MKSSIGTRSAAAAISLLFLAACSSGLQIRSDVDPTVDLNQFSTYQFFEELGIEGGYNSPVFGEHFRSAISREMGARGFRQSYNPDLLVNVTIRADDQVRLRSFSQPYMSGHYYDRPGGAHYGTGVGVGVGVGTRATKVTEASVFIDLVDPRAHRVTWQGVAVFDANEKVATRLRDSVFTVVEAIMAQYPSTASR
jgi:hypothetical protein